MAAKDYDGNMDNGTDTDRHNPRKQTQKCSTIYGMKSDVYTE